MPPASPALRFIDQARRDLVRRLPAFLRNARWFGGKARRIRGVRLLDAVALSRRPRAFLLLVQVRYAGGPAEQYLLPVRCLGAGPRESVATLGVPRPVIATVHADDGDYVCADGVDDRETQARLLTLVTRGGRVRGLRGAIVGRRGRSLRRILSEHPEAGLLRDCRVIGKDQSNSSLLYGNVLFFKLFRKPEAGLQPDIEVVQFLTEKARYANVPSFAGSLEYRRHGRRPIAIGTVQAYVPNRGDGWAYALGLVTRYFERVRARQTDRQTRPPPPTSPFDVARGGALPLPRRLIGTDALAMAALLGTRTGELHRALASERRDPAFTPSPCTRSYQRAVVREQLARAATTFRLLRNSLPHLPAAVKNEAEAVLRLRPECLARIRQVGVGRPAALRIRCHGDYHLGQVLVTDHDVIIIDFEGEPATPLRTRRAKHPPFRDAAGMMRSFHYAAYAGLFRHAEREARIASLRPWAEAWYSAMAGSFLRAYEDALAGSPLVPAQPAITTLWLTSFFLDKALYEVAYELNHRPAWLRIPLSGIRQAIVREPARTPETR